MTALDIARANRIQRSEQQQIVNKANPMAGYTVVYKAVTECTALSDGAYRTYMILLGYDYHNGRAIFPGLDTLAAQRGVARRTIQGHITELKAAGLLVVERRGLNLTNEYELPDASAWTPDALVEWQKSAHPQNGERSGSILHIQSGKNLHIRSGKNLPPNKEQVKKEQVKKEEGVGADKPRRAPSARSTSSLKDTDLEHVPTDVDPDAPAARRLALDLAHNIIKWDSIGVDTLKRYERLYTARLGLPYQSEDYEDAELRLMAFNGWLESNGYWAGKGYMLTDSKFAAEWNDWVGSGEPAEKRRAGKAQSSINAAYRDANGGA